VSNDSNSVVIIGAGIIGTVAAFRLAKSGYRVVVLDPTPGRGATFAAAGMLAPRAEITPGELSNFMLQLRAVQAWRELSESVSAVTGSNIAIHQTGTLLVGWDQSDRRQVSQFAEVATSFGYAPSAVGRSDSASMFHGVSQRIGSGLYLDDDAWVNPDEAMSALRGANEQLGVTYFNEKCDHLSETGAGVEVFFASSHSHFDAALVATGHSSLLDGVEIAEANDIRPVRGFTIRVSGVDRSFAPTLRAVVRGRNFYLVSRPGGYCVLGASVEEKSAPVIEIGEMQRLLRDALEVVPDLETATFLDARSGLRPSSRDGEPFFRLSSGGRVAWASGHYRHGVTLAPVVANDVLEFVEGVSSDC